MKLVDLHVHSTASDGTYTPSEVVSFAGKAGLSAIALTDHDTIDGLSEAMECGRKLGVEVIPGIELSSAYQNKEIHIVGLFIEPDNTIFQKQLESLRITRDERNERICEKFKEQNIFVTMEDLTKAFPGAVITRAHFARYLYEQGYTRSIRETFDRYLNDRGPCFVPRYRIPYDETIRMLHDAGGIAILAHPILYQMGHTELEKMLQALSRCGLDGIEAIYSTYTNTDEIEIRRLAKTYHLAISGGSDFHGSNKPSIHLGIGKGNLKVPYSVLENLRSH